MAVTAKGQKLFAELFVPARGPKPNTAILKSLDPSVITPSGHVKVLSNLQVRLKNGKTNVFVLGDIIDWNEQHQGMKVMVHVDVVTANILGAINGRSTLQVVSRAPLIHSLPKCDLILMHYRFSDVQGSHGEHYDHTRTSA